MAKKILPLIIIILIAVGAIFFVFIKNTSSPLATLYEDKPVLKESINGILVEEKISKQRPIAVMIENHPDSRPQSGLDKADLVYETLAEGGITRFVGVFQTNQKSKVGPVRSARDYFAEIADELGAGFAHVGGSDEVLAQLSAGKYKNLTDINEYFNGGYFERIKTRLAPHNAYASLEKLNQYLVEKRETTKASFDPWKFKDDESIEQAVHEAENITINFSTPGYDVKYFFDQSQNNYTRHLAGKTHLIDNFEEKTKVGLIAKVVIVQFVPVSAVAGDEKARIDINLKGQGKAIVFQDGHATIATWKKTGSNRTKYYDSENKEISFNRGQIWIELVPNDSPSTRVKYTPNK